MDKHTNHINWIAIVSGIATIITVVTFFAKGFGSMAVAQKDVDDLKNFKETQIQKNSIYDNTLARMDENLKSLMGYFKITPK